MFNWSFLTPMIKWVLRRAVKPDERQRILFVTERELPPEIFAILRLTWYHDNKPHRIDEVVLQEEEGIQDGFVQVIVEALKTGADVSILTEYNAESLGIYANQ